MTVAVIGFGRMGQRHIQVVRELGLTLAGVCDLNIEALSEAAAKLSIPESLRYSNAADMFRAVSPQCVIVATTAPTHCEYTCLAAANGAKFILCEKPMAVSLEECDRMLECCARQGVLLAVNHQMRFMDQYTEPKAIIESEAFGGLSSATVIAGNFGMAMNATHYFEMFRFLTDEFPSAVTAWFSDALLSNPRGPQFEDRAGSLRLTTPSGKRLYLEAGDDQGQGFGVVYAGRFGQLWVDELAGVMRWMVREEEYRSLPTTRYGMPWVEQTRKIAPADVIGPSKAVLKALLEKKNYPSGIEGRSAVEVLVAAHVSHESRHVPVMVGRGLPLDRKFPWA